MRGNYQQHWTLSNFFPSSNRMLNWIVTNENILLLFMSQFSQFSFSLCLSTAQRLHKLHGWIKTEIKMRLAIFIWFQTFISCSCALTEERAETCAPMRNTVVSARVFPVSMLARTVFCIPNQNCIIGSRFQAREQEVGQCEKISKPGIFINNLCGWLYYLTCTY